MMNVHPFVRWNNKRNRHTKKQTNKSNRWDRGKKCIMPLMRIHFISNLPVCVSVSSLSCPVSTFSLCGPKVQPRAQFSLSVCLSLSSAVMCGERDWRGGDPKRFIPSAHHLTLFLTTFFFSHFLPRHTQTQTDTHIQKLLTKKGQTRQDMHTEQRTNCSIKYYFFLS